MPNYRAFEKIMRALVQRKVDAPIDPRSLAAHADLTVETVRETLPDLEARRYVRLSGVGGYAMVEAARRHAGKNAAQFLALDVAKWTEESRKASVRVDELPAEYREDVNLLELALWELAGFAAVQPHTSTSTGRIDWFRVKPRLTLYGSESAGSQVPPVQVIQNIGEYVGGDKNTNTGSGAIVTGDHNTVSINADAAESFRQFVEALREQRTFDVDALDVLADAARPGTPARTAKAIITGAAAEQPGLGAKVKDWFVGLPGRLADAAIVEGAMLFLKANGLL